MPTAVMVRSRRPKRMGDSTQRDLGRDVGDARDDGREPQVCPKDLRTGKKSSGVGFASTASARNAIRRPTIFFISC